MGKKANWVSLGVGFLFSRREWKAFVVIFRLRWLRISFWGGFAAVFASLNLDLGFCLGLLCWSG
jgi:hypothetical protein